MMQITETVKHLILINILFFVGAQFVAESHALLPMYYFENPLFQFWQPLTSMFMHGGIGHILFNMFGLYMFGSTLEQYWGAKKFLFFYISCGLGAALVHQGVNYLEFQGAYSTLIENGISPAEISTLLEKGSVSAMYASDNVALIQEAVNKLSGAYSIPVVGASGAIYGILVAFAFMFPNVKLMLLFLPVPIAAKYFVPAILLIDLLSGLNGNSVFGTSTGIAHFAHLGGALTGFLIMWYWKKNQFNDNRWN
jgi:membrane associated rhomboid family serine protease